MSTEPTKPVHVQDNDFEVGYGKPPEHTKFKKGQSGNPNGRPKTDKRFVYEDPIKMLLRQPIAEAIDLSDKKMPTYLAFLKMLIRNALKSDTKAIQMLLDKTDGLKTILDEKKQEATTAHKEFLQQLRDDVEKWIK